ncbi:MAG: shikimate kinase [Actinobacteria bacterium]|nr:shikimate kinase [Actinomycetota bacterium]
MAPSSPPSEDHLVLVGMMGSGKTSVGQVVAQRLGRRFLDSDEQVEARAGRSVREIFESDGEAAFRRLETDALAEALESPEPVVVAAAGGVVLDASNRRLLREQATVVWLRAEPSVLATRVRPGDHRPLLAQDPLGVLRRMDADRRELYAEVADHVVDVGRASLSEAVESVLEALGR